MQNDSLIVRCPRIHPALPGPHRCLGRRENHAGPARAGSLPTLEPEVSPGTGLLPWTGMPHLAPTPGARL
ncbi:hypothetical protein GCM10008960_19250 [Deinococcus sedimenti]|uniref:Uncharacterized protein n=1 Tax=Deinococcus sedimenti TaxID=1867090 RepID=A0ABQ2S5G7_9DEIO|nr:hypothetical protein GCM10008960_19250 [Deinococcus sedimenti]